LRLFDFRPLNSYKVSKIQKNPKKVCGTLARETRPGAALPLFYWLSGFAEWLQIRDYRDIEDISAQKSGGKEQDFQVFDFA